MKCFKEHLHFSSENLLTVHSFQSLGNVHVPQYIIDGVTDLTGDNKPFSNLAGQKSSVLFETAVKVSEGEVCFSVQQHLLVLSRAAVRRFEVDFNIGNHSMNMPFSEQRCNKLRDSVVKKPQLSSNQHEMSPAKSHISFPQSFCCSGVQVAKRFPSS